MGKREKGKLRALPKTIGDQWELRSWVEWVTGLKMPVRGVCKGHQAPFEYLKKAYFEPAGDLVVWAPRGGGKTRLGAIATLLDLVFKPGCQVRIIGGSLEQSMKMWEHLRADTLRAMERGVVRGKVRERRIELANGSVAAVLTQSERAVRGVRVQKMRCDEVEDFTPRVWEAAQLTTRSLSRANGIADCGSQVAESKPVVAGAAVEAYSTWHRRFGMMRSIVDGARERGTPVLQWCLLDVLEKCPPTRACAGCPLWEDCGGAAREAQGFFKIDDAIAMKRRVSLEVWESEMLCRKLSSKDSVFKTFDESIHVRESVPWPHPSELLTWLAMDFGYVNPFVCLFIRTDPQKSAVHVFDEYVQEQRMLEEHLIELKRRWPGKIFRVACDPAGKQRNDQTAQSNVQVLRKQYQVRCRSLPIAVGLDKVRRALKPALGPVTLFVHPRCTRLIRALHAYRYDGSSEVPVKDGVHDHLIDALRYFFVNREAQPVQERMY
jgi:hypothetical protein